MTCDIYCVDSFSEQNRNNHEDRVEDIMAFRIWSKFQVDLHSMLVLA